MHIGTINIFFNYKTQNVSQSIPNILCKNNGTYSNLFSNIE